MSATLLAAIAIYYRRKFKRLHKKYHHKRPKRDQPKTKERKVHAPRKAKLQESFSESKSESDLNQAYFQQIAGHGDLYHEQYNEHGVKIEPELSEAELIQQYFHDIRVEETE